MIDKLKILERLIKLEMYIEKDKDVSPYTPHEGYNSAISKEIEFLKELLKGEIE